MKKVLIKNCKLSMFGINFLCSFRKRSETFKSCKETFLNLMAFRWLSTLFSTSFQMWRQFINTFHFGAWNRNFSTWGSILTTPFLNYKGSGYFVSLIVMYKADLTTTKGESKTAGFASQITKEFIIIFYCSHTARLQLL